MQNRWYVFLIVSTPKATDGNKGKPIVGVVFNYRTGIFGFPVGAKAEENRALNLGLYDQRAAIEW